MDGEASIRPKRRRALIAKELSDYRTDIPWLHFVKPDLKIERDLLLNLKVGTHLLALDRMIKIYKCPSREGKN